MPWFDSLLDPQAIFVTDTSVLINLNSTGRAAGIFGELPCRFVVPEIVQSELEMGKRKGHTDADALEELCQNGRVSIIELGTRGASIFNGLITGSQFSVLDGGEAATIGCAVELSGIALIDELKATRACKELFSNTSVVSTVEFLLSKPVENILGKQGQRETLLNAVQKGRMHILSRFLDEVQAKIGNEI